MSHLIIIAVVPVAMFVFIPAEVPAVVVAFPSGRLRIKSDDDPATIRIPNASIVAAIPVTPVSAIVFALLIAVTVVIAVPIVGAGGCRDGEKHSSR